jgi:[acyl-carrier-protein] S-malonyltransferase
MFTIHQMRLAYIFPGQGSQIPGMGKNLAEKFPAARQVFEEVDEALQFSVSRLCFEGSPEELQLTENTQPAILAVSAAATRVLEGQGFPRPQFVAGHSLGEYSALLAARSLTLPDAIRTVRLRGRYMQEAVPVGAGAMAAVIGVALKDIEAACAEAAQDQVCAPANINSPGQVVIAGNTEAVDRASELLRSRGAKRVLKLNVRQVSAPVRWLESIQLLIGEGVDTFVEVGPGKVLTGLLRQINRDVKCYNIEDEASLQSTAAALGIS